MNKTNTLIKEKSPYLLQHATNPVDWYPWIEEAFQKAEYEDKPIFLSIGYSTCHWCHVMERESFIDMEIAGMLNKNFVSIKVDREERPDIDAVYMEVCQAMTGNGGWPLTIIMTPDKKPFFAGTYLPKRNNYNQLGLYELLEYVASMWARDREKLVTAGDKLIEYLTRREDGKDRDQDRSVPDIVEHAYARFDLSFDEEHGGFGHSPKFPTAHNLLFLLYYADVSKVKKAREMAEKTIIEMYRGGIFDHIGGGFCRYSTDNKWLVPHFEKMLYDNAMMIYTYSTFLEKCENMDTYKLFSDIIAQTVSYVLTELKSEDGAFYCAQDADVDGKEGEFYLLTRKEISEALGKEDAQRFCSLYDIGEKAHYEGKSIPNLLNNPEYGNAAEATVSSRDKLKEYRKTRAKLFTDDKVLTSWNALMIAALAKAGKVLGREKYIKCAEKAAKFIEKYLACSDGSLYIMWRDGEAKHRGVLDDYAYYAWAMIELYESTFDVSYLIRACNIADMMTEKFGDGDNGLYLYEESGEKLIIRPKNYYDGALPSGNSVAARVFNTLYKLTADVKWQGRIKKQFEAIIPQAERYPTAFGYALLAMAELGYPKPELIVTTPNSTPPQFVQGLSGVDIIVKTPENKKELEKVAPFTENYPIAETPTYYYCLKGLCNKPVTDEKELIKLMK